MAARMQKYSHKSGIEGSVFLAMKQDYSQQFKGLVCLDRKLASIPLPVR